MKTPTEKYEISTPALIIDLDVMEKNISTMADCFRSSKAYLRPHIKTHKTPAIAYKQIQAGARGITCQTMREAEVMAAAGIRDILITNYMVDDVKIQRLVSLAHHSDVIVSVDNRKNAEELSNAAQKKGIALNVTIEITMGRCGVEPGEAAVSLAKHIATLKGLRFKGIWCHNGGVGRISNLEQRRVEAERALSQAIKTRDMIENDGIKVEIVSGGSTPDHQIAAQYPGITEVQAGAYVFMDPCYKSLQGFEKFNYALTVLGTVLSRPSAEKAIIDVGMKSIAPEFGLPRVKDAEDLEVLALNEEHGHLKIQNSKREVRVGSKLELIPGHCCGTVNLHDKYYGIRNGQIEAVWDISAKFS